MCYDTRMRKVEHVNDETFAERMMIDSAKELNEIDIEMPLKIMDFKIELFERERFRENSISLTYGAATYAILRKRTIATTTLTSTKLNVLSILFVPRMSYGQSETNENEIIHSD